MIHPAAVRCKPTLAAFALFVPLDLPAPAQSAYHVRDGPSHRPCLEVVMRPLPVSPRRAALASLTSLVALALAPPASAQVIGPIKWQLQPYCNVVVLTATAEAGGFRLAGVDDGCGLGASPAAGRATVDADGSITLAFVVVGADGAAIHTAAHLAPLAFDGTWRDAGGSSGGFVAVANSPILAGTRRPFVLAGGGPIPADSVTGASVVDGTLTAADVDASSVQRRIATPCPAGQFAQQVNADGTLSCAAVAGSAGGDITAVAAGNGLTGGGTTGDVSLAIAAGGVGPAALAAGAVTADKLAAGAVGSAAIANGTIAAVDVNAAEIQRRVTTACAAGSFFQSVNADGSAVCVAGGGGAGGGIGTVVAGTGLTGGGSTPTVALAVAPQGISGALIAPGAVGAAQLAADAVAGGHITDGTVGAADINATEVQRRVTGTCSTGVFATGVDAAGSLACTDGGAATSVLMGSGTGTGAATVTAAQVVAVGVDALRVNAATGNTAVGYRALTANSSGATNVAVGGDALVANQLGSSNTAVGTGALDSLVTGARNLALGNGAGGIIVGGNDNVYLAHPGVVGDDATIRIGNGLTQNRLFAAGVYGTTVTLGQQVYVDTNGQLGTLQSSERFKTDVADMAGTSRRLLDLRAVTFRYRDGMATAAGERQYGLVAEEVAQVYPDLVTRDRDGRIDGVQYHKLAPMLLNEVQRQQREIDALKAQMTDLLRRLDGK